MILEDEQEGATYLQPTNLGEYFWIWLLKSDGLMASLLTVVHRLWVSFANSGYDGVKEGKEKKHNCCLFGSTVGVLNRIGNFKLI